MLSSLDKMGSRFQVFTVLLCFVATFASLVALDQVVSEIVVIENEIKIPNDHRGFSPSLKLSINGAKIVSCEKNSTAWRLVLSDKTAAEIKIVEGADNETRFDLLWPGANGQSADREVCFHYGWNNASWYSTYQSVHSKFPMDPAKQLGRYQFNNNLDPFLYTTNKDAYFILEHLFVNTDGFAVMLDEHVPWFMRMDPNRGDPVWCVSANNSEPYMQTELDVHYRDIKVHIFAARDIKQVTDAVVHRSGLIPKPTQIPDERRFVYPSWSSTGLGYNVKQDQILSFARKLASHGLANHSEITIDDKWFTKLGELSFEPAQYTDANSMVEQLTQLGIHLTLNVNPYVDSHNADMEKYMIHDQSGNATKLIDFAIPEARQWYLSKLNEFSRKYSVLSFTIANFNTMTLKPNNAYLQKYPSSFSTKYIDTVASSANSSHVTDTAYKAQHLAIFTRQFNYYFAMPFGTLLKQLIPNMLSVSIGGYSFVSPYTIGGLYGYYNKRPSEEVYIRWLQAATFMPNMLISIPPWNYSDRTLAIAKKYIELHKEYAPTLLDLARSRIHEGSPIVRPLWYVAPEDTATYSIDDQYMMGDNLLVAPVLAEGQTERVVYLPEGVWIDQHGAKYHGPGHIKVLTPIEELPYFRRSTESNQSFTLSKMVSIYTAVLFNILMRFI